MRPWSDLPEDLLASIANRLEDPLDSVRFRSVCSSWRSSSPMRKAFPDFSVKFPFPISPNDNNDPYRQRQGYFALSKSKVYVIQPPQQENGTQESGTWLVRVKKGENGKFVLLNPLDKDLPIKNSSLKVLDLLDFRVTQVAQCYSLDFIEHFSAIPVEGHAVSVHKVLFDGSVVVGIKDYPNSLFFRRLTDDKWVLPDFEAMDIAVHKGKYFAVKDRGDVTVFDSDFRVSETIKTPIRSCVYDRFFYLIESFGDLFLVYSYIVIGSRVQFTVYKLDEEKSQWDEVNRLDDRTFFLSESCTFSVMAKDFLECKRNCIYYGLNWRDGTGRLRRNLYPVDFNSTELHYRHIGVLDLVYGDCGSIADCPGYDEIFWPPPTWLRTGSSSSGVQNVNAKRHHY
ncbi:hypothetical protein JCGZ_22343 [Jatropha curcas]|uniref:Uncharacterized protein n=1 Tax=Jatropha curcas TaxID=180498 RepID=A0A067L5K1_JATCU|nr:F-box protein SKIP23 [Jatropha curcas]KDP43716.1 hypothetical protein JCGZ_22343 [Jatropha curcas]